MDNLQSEVLEIEFRKFSGGNDTITHAAFAKSLLRFTQIADIEASLQQLNERLTPENSKVRSYPLTSKWLGEGSKVLILISTLQYLF